MRSPDELDRRVEAARRLLRERRLTVDPDPQFAARVLARLSSPEAWVFAWAVRRVLPATLAVAAVLTAAIFATRSAPVASAPASTVSESQGSGDPLDWVLEGRQEPR